MVFASFEVTDRATVTVVSQASLLLLEPSNFVCSRTNFRPLRFKDLFKVLRLEV
jgi:hypothetical protein